MVAYCTQKFSPQLARWSTSMSLRTREEHGFGFGLFRTGFMLFYRIWIGLGCEILASTGFGFIDFFDNFGNMLENVEMTHERNKSFEYYAVIIHFFRL